jgi:predicted AAA+ superfamily ATPase
MNEKHILQILLGEFYNKLNHLQDLVVRDLSFPNAPNKIKVAIGMRRAGKTYFVYQTILQLLKRGIDRSTILYINFEDDRLLPIEQQKFAALVDSFYSLYPENHDKKCYLFFDEVQNIQNWATVVRRLHDSKNVEIYLTGSSSKMLSTEIATNLRGRSLAVEVWPYSFNEYLRAKNINIKRNLFDKKTQDQLTKVFNIYLSAGGFPEIISFSQDLQQKTLQEYLNVTIYRDIIDRYTIKNPTLIKYMILSMMHSAGKPFTVNKFYNDLKSQGYAATKDTLYDYLDYIEDAYLAFSVPLFNKSLRKIQTNPKKLYAIDTGMIRAITLDYENDLGRLFENIIFLELKRQNCKISYYLTAERYEIDFLIQTPRGHKKLFQVAWNTDDKQTLEREQRALQIAMKEQKIKGELITLSSYLEKGINLD